MSAPTASERWNDPHIMAALQLSLRCAAQHHGTAGRAGACVDCIAAALSAAEGPLGRDPLAYKIELDDELAKRNLALEAAAEGLAKALEKIVEHFEYENGQPPCCASLTEAGRAALTAYRAPFGAEKVSDPPSQSMLGLAKKAANKPSITDVDAWAKKLADEMSKLND